MSKIIKLSKGCETIVDDDDYEYLSQFKWSYGIKRKEYPGATKWFNKTMKGELEADLKKEGWERWYNVYNYPYDVIYGHSVVKEPRIIQTQEGVGRSIGIDTGSVFGGFLTACIYPDMKFIQVKCKHYTGELKFELLEDVRLDAIS